MSDERKTKAQLLEEIRSLQHRVSVLEGGVQTGRGANREALDPTDRTPRESDISERRRLEAPFRQAQKMEGIGRLAGGLAHEFNNLITGITGYAGLVRDALPAGSPAHDDIERVLGSAARAAELARKLLALSRRQPLSQDPTVAPRGHETVLVVEDDRSVRRLEVLILRGLGYRVLEAAVPEEALRLSRETEGAIDVLVTDLAMPQMGGAELAERIRTERPGIGVLLVSGYGEATMERPRRGLRRRRFLEKPFTEVTLGNAVRALLDESRA